MENNLTTIAAKPASLLEYRQRSDVYPRIKTIADKQAVETLRTIVWKAYMYRGNSADDETVNFTTEALYNEILLDRDHYGLRELTLQEIDHVIRAAALNQGREMYGICVASLYAALCDYAKTTGHELEKKVNVKPSLAIESITSVYGQQLLKNNK